MFSDTVIIDTVIIDAARHLAKRAVLPALSIAVIVGLQVSSCRPLQPERASESALTRYQYTQLHLGVQVRMIVYAEKEDAAAVGAKAVFARIAQLEDVFSSYRSHSELSRLSQSAHENATPVSDALFTALRAAQALSAETEGAFDITAGPLIDLWRESRDNKRLPTDQALNTAMERTGWRLVELDEQKKRVTLKKAHMKLDMGGIAKGFILDEALKVLKSHGLHRALIEAGGDIVIGNPPPGRDGWGVHVPGAPPESDLFRAAQSLSNAAVSTSGDTEQYAVIEGVRYAHVVNPATGLGLTHRTMATVIAPDGLTSDGYATALTVLDSKERNAFLSNHPEVMAFIRTVE